MKLNLPVDGCQIQLSPLTLEDQRSITMEMETLSPLWVEMFMVSTSYLITSIPKVETTSLCTNSAMDEQLLELITQYLKLTARVLQKIEL